MTRRRIAGDYAMILPVRLNLNEEVLAVADFVFDSVSRRCGALFGRLESRTTEWRHYVGGARTVKRPARSCMRWSDQQSNWI